MRILNREIGSSFQSIADLVDWQGIIHVSAAAVVFGTAMCQYPGAHKRRIKYHPIAVVAGFPANSMPTTAVVLNYDPSFGQWSCEHVYMCTQFVNSSVGCCGRATSRCQQTHLVVQCRDPSIDGLVPLLRPQFDLVIQHYVLIATILSRYALKFGFSGCSVSCPSSASSGLVPSTDSCSSAGFSSARIR